MEFNEILKDIMIEKGLTQTALSELLEISQGQISDWLNGHNLPGYYNLKKICTKLQISGDEILDLVSY